jgi:hypothetical protein
MIVKKDRWYLLRQYDKGALYIIRGRHIESWLLWFIRKESDTDDASDAIGVIGTLEIADIGDEVTILCHPSNNTEKVHFTPFETIATVVPQDWKLRLQVVK